MLKSSRFWFLAIIGVMALILGVDWLYNTSRARQVQMEITANPEMVVADGKNKTILTIRVTENGQPRGNDLIQLWLDKGSGLVIPNWVMTNADGIAEVTYTPNPYSPYDPQEGATIIVMDTSIGRLVEVDKREQITVNLEAPE